MSGSGLASTTTITSLNLLSTTFMTFADAAAENAAEERVIKHA